MTTSTKAQSFDAVAEAYDRFRPAYPSALRAPILARLGVKQGATLLEIGCGTGKATAMFAGLGHYLHALDSGPNLLAIAASRFSSDSRLSFECSRFEDWPAPSHHFDLVFSAQAFHWLDKNIAYPKIAQALKSKGWLALLWHIDAWADSEIRRALDSIYADFLPHNTSPFCPDHLAQQCATDLAASGLFSEPEVHTHFWTQSYSSEEYLGLLSTFSDHITLPETQRDALFAAIRKLIDEHGGTIEKPYRSALYMAQVI